MLNKIPSNSIVFIDSNIFIYHFLGASEPCTDFLERIEMGNIEAYTSTVVLAERFVESAAMKINGLKDMVTNDSDFDKVEWLTIWKP